MERPKGIGPVVDASLLAVRDREINDFKVVFHLVERRFPHEHFGANRQSFVVGGRGQHVKIVDVVEQPRAREGPVDAARVQRAGNGGLAGIEEGQACAAHLAESWRGLNAVQFNTNNGLTRIIARSKKERNGRDVRCVFRQIERVESCMMGGERDGLTGQPARVCRRVNRLHQQGQRRGVHADTKTTELGVDVERDIENSPRVGACRGRLGIVQGRSVDPQAERGVRQEVHELQHLDIG